MTENDGGDETERTEGKASIWLWVIVEKRKYLKWECETLWCRKHEKKWMTETKGGTKGRTEGK